MIQYIKDVIATMPDIEAKGIDAVKIRGHQSPSVRSIYPELLKELDKLNAADFAPSVRRDFVLLRAKLHGDGDGDEKNVVALATTVSSLLDYYGGEGSGAASRSFPTVTNPDLLRIIDRDYAELSLRAFPDGAWKSTVVLAGSILEAVLYDRLTRDAATIASAMSSSLAPKLRSRVTKDLTKHNRANEWSLSNMIAVASDLHLLPPADKVAIDQVLREYRNFVHPRVEIVRGISITEGHATAAKGMLEVILDELK